MKIKKLNIEKPYLVSLCWRDAQSNATWSTPDQILYWVNLEEFIISEHGWLLHKDKHMIIIAGQRTSKNTDFQWGNLTMIPSDWVISLKKLK